MQRDMRALVEGADRRGERLAAVLALVDAGAGALALHFRCVGDRTTVRADRAIGPAQRLEMPPGSVFVVKDWVCQARHVSTLFDADFLPCGDLVRQVHNSPTGERTKHENGSSVNQNVLGSFWRGATA